MKNLLYFSVLMSLFSSITLCTLTVTSPDQKIEVTLSIKELLEPYPAGNWFYYAVSLNGKPIITDSPFRLDFKGMPPFAQNLTIKEEKRLTFNETWQPLLGTHKEIVNHFNELQVSLSESSAPHRTIHLLIRAFNDGVALRYSIPEQPAISAFKLAKEYTSFNFPHDATVWAANYESFTTHQESEYLKTRLSALHSGAIIGCPLLIQLPYAWVALTEANLTDWAGLYFTKNPAVMNGTLSLLSPRLDEPDVAVISQAPRVSPWRVIMINEKAGGLIESNIISNLNDPCRIEDPSWIESGLSAWDRWWCGSYAPDFKGILGVDNASMKYFIDFAAEMGWEYQLVDWYWYGMPFDPAKPLGAAENPAVSIIKQAKEIDIPELVQYGKKKGVKILIWLDWFHADKEMEAAFPLYEQWGVAGVKVDFMARDDQQIVNFYHRLVKLAAKHHLIVDFHGAYKPTGFRRTWPNLITREGVLGNEYNKWSDRITPTHNVTLPFTRMLCGPMDYTPGGFRNKNVDDFRVVGGDAPGPFVMTTRAQQLAMFVVYESPLQVACDGPYNYRTNPAGLEFLKAVPTSWDDSKVLDGFPGDFILMARLSGKEWFVGGMTNETARSVTFPLAFLGSGNYIAKIYSDAEETAEYPDHLQVTEKKVTAKEILTINMASGGGFVIQLIPTE
jgi:alpha-glucosidase